jgi:hypothetical protein
MRYFRHTIAEHPCSKQCGYVRSDIEANMSPFHLIAAATATVPLWLFSIHEGFQWYYLASILAGELLLVFFSGFLSAFLMILFGIIGLLVKPFGIVGPAHRCPKCGAPLVFGGRHFNPLGSRRPHWSDIVIFLVFVALNIGIWVSLANGNL